MQNSAVNASLRLPRPEAVLFDLGKVVLDWDPRYYYARHFGADEAGLEHFVRHVVAPDWIGEMDAGKSAAQAMGERQRLHPPHAELIGLWMEGWPHMLRGEIAGTGRIVRELKAAGVRLYALTNFSTETFPIALARCPTLSLFKDIVMSGRIGLLKPDPRIYAHALSQCRLDAARTVFIDDLPQNVAGARAAGLHGLQFVSPPRLRADLRQLGFRLDPE